MGGAACCLAASPVFHQVLATIEAPTAMVTRGEGCLIEARVCRIIRRTGAAEMDAIRVSESLPFIEYELQRQLSLKLKVSMIKSTRR
jgi:hypothetical protein